MLENNPKGLERAIIVRVVWNQYYRLLGQQRDLSAHRKAPPRRTVERRTGDPATDSRVTASTVEGRVTALRVAEVRRRRSKKQEMPPPTRRAEVGESATSVGVRSTLRINTVACAEAWSTGLAIVRS